MGASGHPYDFQVRTLQGQPADLSTHAGKVLLVVNTASQCGLIPQYAGLEALWKRYKDRGLVVLGFPCNQFGGQEPGDAEQIAGFCQKNYGVTFPMHEKVEVNGPGAHPLWQWLKEEAPGVLGTEGIKWNFTKFLLDRQGKVVKRYAPTTTPESLAADIEALLGAGARA
jgi:glutathione peroxidase